MEPSGHWRLCLSHVGRTQRNHRSLDPLLRITSGCGYRAPTAFIYVLDLKTRTDSPDAMGRAASVLKASATRSPVSHTAPCVPAIPHRRIRDKWSGGSWIYVSPHTCARGEDDRGIWSRALANDLIENDALGNQPRQSTSDQAARRQARARPGPCRRRRSRVRRHTTCPSPHRSSVTSRHAEPGPRS